MGEENLEALRIQNIAINNNRNTCIREFGYDVLRDTAQKIFNSTINTWMCPAVFDDILCWPPTPVNTLAQIPCPTYFVGFDRSNENASRFCTSQGQWYFHKGINKYWSNYSKCYGSERAIVRMNISVDVPDMNNSLVLNYLSSIKTLSRIGYSVSLCTLLIAFIIMFSIKKLHCPRNKLHMHLFASFILRAFISLLKDALFVEGVGLASDIMYKNGTAFFFQDTDSNNWSCKLVTSLWEFFFTANYSWILMEGIYLHNLIFRALFSDTNANVRNYIIFGWGAPVLVIIPWIITRIIIEDTLCWTMHSDQKWTVLIIVIPIVTSILINLVLFVKITAVILNKLRSSLNAEAQRYKKWARSTLVLVPLFGVHYAVFLGMSFSIGKNETVEVIWLICDQLFGSFQGCFVAILYCFLNGEVRSELKPYFCSLLSYCASISCCHCCCSTKKLARSAKTRSSVCTMVSNASICNNAVHHNQIRAKHDTGQQTALLDRSKLHVNMTMASSYQDISPKKKYLLARYQNGPMASKCQSTSEGKFEENENAVNAAFLNVEDNLRCQSEPYICKEMICMLPKRR